MGGGQSDLKYCPGFSPSDWHIDHMQDTLVLEPNEVPFSIYNNFELEIRLRTYILVLVNQPYSTYPAIIKPGADGPEFVQSFFR